MKDKAKSESPLIGERSLQKCKDQIAWGYSVFNGQSHSYKDWQEMEWYLIQNDLIADLLMRSDEAAELYASQFKAKEHSLPEATAARLLLEIRNDPKLWRSRGPSGADAYQGMPPFVRLIDEVLGEAGAKEDNIAFGEWISVEERKPEIGEDGESEDVLCLGFKCSREDTETYEIMRWVKLTRPDMLNHKGEPIEYGWSNRWWDTNPDGVDVHYWKPLSSPGPIKWK